MVAREAWARILGKRSVPTRWLESGRGLLHSASTKIGGANKLLE